MTAPKPLPRRATTKYIVEVSATVKLCVRAHTRSDAAAKGIDLIQEVWPEVDGPEVVKGEGGVLYQSHVTEGPVADETFLCTRAQAAKYLRVRPAQFDKEVVPVCPQYPGGGEPLWDTAALDKWDEGLHVALERPQSKGR